MSGSCGDSIANLVRKSVGLAPTAPTGFYDNRHTPTGTANIQNRQYELSDELWNKMYLEPRPVIIVCSFCDSHNVITSPTCIQCGAPMGKSKERVYV